MKRKAEKEKKRKERKEKKSDYLWILQYKFKPIFRNRPSCRNGYNMRREPQITKALIRLRGKPTLVFLDNTSRAGSGVSVKESKNKKDRPAASSY